MSATFSTALPVGGADLTLFLNRISGDLPDTNGYDLTDENLNCIYSKDLNIYGEYEVAIRFTEDGPTGDIYASGWVTLEDGKDASPRGEITKIEIPTISGPNNLKIEVKDSETSEILSDVAISVSSPGYSEVKFSNLEEGKAIFTIPSGAWEIKLYKGGFLGKTISTTVVEDTDIEVPLVSNIITASEPNRCSISLFTLDKFGEPVDNVDIEISVFASDGFRTPTFVNDSLIIDEKTNKTTTNGTINISLLQGLTCKFIASYNDVSKEWVYEVPFSPSETITLEV